MLCASDNHTPLVDRVITLLATEADIQQLEKTLSWGPMLVPPSMRDICHVELLDVSNNSCHTFVTVRNWREVKTDSHLVMPEGISVDHRLEPLSFSERLAGDLNHAVYGDRTRVAMHLRTEAHFHSLEDWLEVETAGGHEHLVKECAQLSKDLRNDHSWTEARKIAYTRELLEEVFEDFDTGR